MKKLFLLTWTFSIVLIGCKKPDTASPNNSDNILSDSTIIVSSDIINSSLISVDSTKLTFTATGSGVDKIKTGSILVSDISTVAPIGFLRKITGITTVGNNKIYTTEQASLTDAIVKGKITFNKTLTDSDILEEDSSGVDISAQQRTQGLSFTFNYNQVVHDADGNSSTTHDQIKIIGEMKIEPSFDFELDIDRRTVNKFLAKITLKNTSKISAESKIVLANFSKGIVLKTFKLKPFTIVVAGVPVPIAKQWIAIVLGIDGNLTARITAGAQNINTAIAGISYQSGTWTTTSTQDNSFTLQPLTFEGAAKVEPWLQARYEIRPYGVRDSRIYLGIKGSVIGEAIVIPAGLSTTLKWGIKFSAKAQMKLFHRSILDFESIFYEREFLIAQSNTFAYPTVTTSSMSSITQSSAQSGGNISSDGGSTVTARGVCWNTSPNPTIANPKTIDGAGTGAYTSLITGLSANTTYYVRAYATNSVGTAYGNVISFTTQQNNTLPNPFALWSFDDCSANDFSGNNQNGIFQRPPPSCQTGVASNSVTFINPLFFQPQGFITPSNLAVNPTAFSISFWVKFITPTTFSPLAYLPFFGMNSSQPLNIWSRYDLNNPSQSYWSVESGPGNPPAVVHYTNPNWAELTNGSWHHFALSCSNGTISFYKNGVLLSTFVIGSSNFNSIILEPTPQHNVSFDQIRLYNVSLSGTQVLYLYNNSL